ncbi:MAG: hypothetical protein O2905_03250 [Proteobacteria bacterium]|nr:hypothetical protein [Pseudomonadota bacterium]MDA1132223.1 hypothetical protein [Pseudomonadota bacterium]
MGVDRTLLGGAGAVRARDQPMAGVIDFARESFPTPAHLFADGG